MGFFQVIPDEANAYEQVLHSYIIIIPCLTLSFSSSSPAARSTNPTSRTELLAGAASFVAAREYEKHCEKNGKPQSHAEAKELLAAFAGAFIDKEVESHGLDFIDKEKAKYDAHKNASDAGCQRLLSRIRCSRNANVTFWEIYC
ncbi:hypothetical protein MVEN_02494700 [Mycena venus]|uniref:Uncharacterized protein n=1 Tax=Mycena venus TaxID=2733690 RepID=A0A8H7CAT3_9AGAR|nr:hypothetical protein MVEN_02494700 [Mycena venus]